MRNSHCHWVGMDMPRMITGRHADECEAPDCRGCQPCTEPLCRVCGITHDADACPMCVDEARTNLHEIRRMVADLPAEVKHRGVNSEAMVLLGPAANPEAWGHHGASALVGRIVPADCDAHDLDGIRDWLGAADHELHPLWVTGTWAMFYEDLFGHETDQRITVEDAVDYLDRHLTAAARDHDVPFEDMAGALRKCVAYLESVLHDGEQVDRGVPCMSCVRRLTRTWATSRRPDGWECQPCRTWSTEEQYRFAVKTDYIKRAEWLTDGDMVVRVELEQMHPITAATVRSWARVRADGALVGKRRQHERVEYRVADVLARTIRRAA